MLLDTCVAVKALAIVAVPEAVCSIELVTEF